MLKKELRVPAFCFKKIYKKGKLIQGRFLFLRLLENQKPVSRFGIVISAKTIKRATDRNLIRRRLAEIIWAHLKKIKPGFDFVFTVKKEAGFHELEEDFKKILNV